MIVRPLIEINQYFKNLKNENPESFNSRIGSFIKILELVNLGNIPALETKISEDKERFGKGLISTRYSNLLGYLLTDLRNGKIESLQEDATEINMNELLAQPEETLSTSISKKYSFYDSLPICLYDSLPISSYHPKEKEEKETATSKTLPNARERVNKIIGLLNQYIKNADTKLKEIAASKIDKPSSTSSSNISLLVNYGVNAIKSKVKEKFYDSNFAPLIFSSSLKREKMAAACNLITNLYEACEYELPEEGECEYELPEGVLAPKYELPEGVLAPNGVIVAAIVFLQDARNEHESLLKNRTVASKGELGRIIDDSLEELKKDFPEEFDVAIKNIKNYLKSK